jgi:hypothetical protein
MRSVTQYRNERLVADPTNAFLFRLYDVALQRQFPVRHREMRTFLKCLHENKCTTSRVLQPSERRGDSDMKERLGGAYTLFRWIFRVLSWHGLSVS